MFYWRGRTSVSSASAQTLVVAEFTNTTGDGVFDGSLRRATIVALRQSPFLNVLSDEAISDALQDLGKPPGGVLSSALARDDWDRPLASSPSEDQRSARRGRATRPRAPVGQRSHTDQFNRTVICHRLRGQ